MKKYVALLSVLCLSNSLMCAKTARSSVQALKKSIKAYDIKQVKSSFEDLENSVESKEQLKEHLDDLIEVAQKAIENVSSSGLSLLGIGSIVMGSMLFVKRHERVMQRKWDVDDASGLIKIGLPILGVGCIGGGGYLVWKGIKDVGSSAKVAQEILEFLEEEHDAL